MRFIEHFGHVLRALPEGHRAPPHVRLHPAHRTLRAAHAPRQETKEEEEGGGLRVKRQRGGGGEAEEERRAVCCV
eukprot:2272528-Rhodomonas_salina.6